MGYARAPGRMTSSRLTAGLGTRGRPAGSSGDLVAPAGSRTVASSLRASLSLPSTSVPSPLQSKTYPSPSPTADGQSSRSLIAYECYHYGGSGSSCQPLLGPVSCPLTTLCVAVDTAGNVLSSTNPTGGAAAWTGASPYAAIPESEAYDGISCPSRSLCAAVDNYAGDVVTWNPTGPPSSRTMAPIDLSAELTGVSCASGSLCFVFDGDGL